ncbi:hypothetical protein CFL01nite_01630 [Corynebacterium flavescens]|uniref:Uncharacterized protein n=1 Tax=Corynebacterium flavescens TaxID=28028 RepID=A0AB73B467_CORFL|nr:hypothetical protein CFL01nite_01630 [Corynebacterium flavescens]
MTGKAGVPRVRVSDVDIGGGISHAQAHGEGLQRGIRVVQLRIYSVGKDILLMAGRARAVNGDINELPHKTRQLCDMYSGAAIDLWRVFLGKDSGSHRYLEYGVPGMRAGTVNGGRGSNFFTANFPKQ